MHPCIPARAARQARLPRVLSVLSLYLALLLPALPSFAAVPGFIPAAGYVAEPIGLQADTFALSPDGRLATGASTSGIASIAVYNHAWPEGRHLVGLYGSDEVRSLGGLAFAGPDTLLVSENGVQDTVYAITLSTGELRMLAPAGSVPNIAQVRVRPTDGAVFAVAANLPGQGAIYRIANGQALPFATGLGNGYLGGLAFDPAGRLYVADTNDPDFTGAPGRVLILSASGVPAGAISLAGGRGSGAYDVARDAYGALVATTGATVTRAFGNAVYPLGRFTGDFPFPTDIAADPQGGILVNGIFTGAAGIFHIRPVRGAFRMPAIRPALPSPIQGPARPLGGR